MLRKLLKNTTLLRVVFIVIALGVAGFGVVRLRQYYNNNIPMQQVLVAKADIQPYSQVELTDLGYMKLPVGSILPGSIQNYNSIVGKYTKTTIYHGEQILPAMIDSKAVLADPNAREVAVPTDIVRSVGMEIKPGDRVDLYFLPGSQQALPDTRKIIRQAVLIAQGALVVNVLNNQDASVFGAISNTSVNAGSTSTGDPNAPAVVILRVDNATVQPIVTAAGNGLIYMAKSLIEAKDSG